MLSRRSLRARRRRTRPQTEVRTFMRFFRAPRHSSRLWSRSACTLCRVQLQLLMESSLIWRQALGARLRPSFAAPRACQLCSGSLPSQRRAISSYPSTSEAAYADAQYRQQPHQEGARPGQWKLDEETPKFRWRAAHFTPIIVPMLLLSVFTSVAFNHAEIAEQIREERKLHARRKAMLHEAREYASRQLSAGAQDEGEGLRMCLRLLKLQLDPLALGFPPDLTAKAQAQLRSSDGSAETSAAGSGDSSDLFARANRETAWSEAFFGRPGQVQGSMRKAVQKAGAMFDSWKMGKPVDGSGSADGAGSLTPEERAEQARADEEWAELQRGERFENGASAVPFAHPVSTPQHSRRRCRKARRQKQSQLQYKSRCTSRQPRSKTQLRHCKQPSQGRRSRRPCCKYRCHSSRNRRARQRRADRTSPASCPRPHRNPQAGPAPPTRQSKSLLSRRSRNKSRSLRHCERRAHRGGVSMCEL